MKIILKRLPHGRDLALPHYATHGAAGLDLIAAVEEEIELLPGQRAAIPCGIAIELPHGYEAQVRPRSGLALNQGVTVLNAPGTIDSDYRGEVKAILINHGAEPYLIKRGAKIAQIVIARHEQAEILESDALSDSARGAGGFGSTGMAAKT
ncbi:MAG TPA: dUTP diphosphatase [Rhizomicrobium sp.]|jgi:dUTP pyrophosphatase|nr:dUTP diphosphatase [Rhizomicrobium sp.]